MRAMVEESSIVDRSRESMLGFLSDEREKKRSSRESFVESMRLYEESFGLFWVSEFTPLYIIIIGKGGPLGIMLLPIYLFFIFYFYFCNFIFFKIKY